MASRESLKQYALRALGAPVLEINVDDDQLEDRIDDALAYWHKYHWDGIEKFYLKHKITASRLEITTSTADSFDVGNTITGATSGATARVTKEGATLSEGTTIIVRDIVGTFTDGEEISNGTVTATLDTNAVTLGDVDNRYIETDEWIYGVNRLLSFANANSSRNLFDARFQLYLRDMWDLRNASIINYNMTMTHLQMLDMELNGLPMIRFNKLQQRLYLDVDWEEDANPGEYIVVDCYRALNPAEFSKVWSEPWLQFYVTALFKKQWATNLKKFQGLQLPGGVTLDGQTLYLEAMQEIQDLETELLNDAAPLEFFVG